MAFYRRSRTRYGLPLDNRKRYTKLDWTLWTATLTGDRGDFDDVLDGVWRFMNEVRTQSTQRLVHLGEWRAVESRPSGGGRLLHQGAKRQAMWNKWAKRERSGSAGWAPLPHRPIARQTFPPQKPTPPTGHSANREPPEGWNRP